MRRYSSRCSLLQSWLWDGREAQGISGWGFVQAEIQMDMLTMCSPLHDIITHYIVWDAVWHYCLAKELARRKSSTMSPAVCMRACVPAWVVWHLMLREIKPLGCPFVYHLGIGSSCAFWLFCKGTPPPPTKVVTFPQSCYCSYSGSPWSEAGPHLWLLPRHWHFPPNLQVVRTWVSKQLTPCKFLTDVPLCQTSCPLKTVHFICMIDKMCH